MTAAGYRPKTAELTALVAALATLYAQKPVTVLHTICAPREKIGR
jgi:hypothetical protein